MGEKGAKLGANAERSAQELTTRLSGAGEVTARKMFGGFGIFESGTMFGLVDSAGTVFLRAGVANTALFEKAGSHRHGKMPYFSVPDRVLSDSTALMKWARAAIEASRESRK